MSIYVVKSPTYWRGTVPIPQKGTVLVIFHISVIFWVKGIHGRY